MKKMDHKKIMEGVLNDLVSDMDDYDYEKKLKPKVIQITIDATGEKPEEMEDYTEMGMSEGHDYDDDDIDPRLRKKLMGKMK